MTHIQRDATTMFPILSAFAAVSLSLAVPSMGATPVRDAEVVTTEAGLDRASSDVGPVTPTVTGIDVRKEADRLSVTINGEGMLSHEAVRVDERRLVIDIPHAFSTFRRPSINVGHRLVKQIRVGEHADKVRLVFDLGRQTEYVVEPRGSQVLLTFKDAAGDSGSEREIAATAEADLPPARVERVADAKTRAVVHGALPAFRVRPIQMMAEPDATEKHTPNDDLVLGETRYTGRRISLTSSRPISATCSA